MLSRNPEPSRTPSKVRSRAPWLAVLATVIFLASACKSSPSPGESDSEEQTEQSTSEARSKNSESNREPDISLSTKHKQRIWRCAAQKSDVSRSKQVKIEPLVLGAIRVALTKAEDEEDIYGRRRRNWNTDWSPDRVSDWGVGWGHRGLTVRGEAHSPGDVAEFLQRLQTSDATHSIQLESLELTSSQNKPRVIFSFVESTALDSARRDDRFQKIVERASEVLVDDLIAEECAWDEDPPKFRPPSGYDSAEWREMDEEIAPLHRIHRWRAKVADDPAKALEKLGERPLDFAGVEVSPRESGSTITLYQLRPREDADVEPPGIASRRTPTKSLIWEPLSGCKDKLCGVTVNDAAVEQRVRKMLEMSRRAGQLRDRLRAINRLSARQVTTEAFSHCLGDFVPVAMPSGEEVTPEEHADRQDEKIVRIQRLSIDKGHYELAFSDTDNGQAGNVPDALAKCVEQRTEIESADVPLLNSGKESVEAMLVIKAKRARSPLDLPPWNPKGNKAQTETIEAFAGPDGTKWESWLKDDIARLQRELLISREKMPDSLGLPGLLTRFENIVASFDARIASFRYVGATPMEEPRVMGHRLELRAQVTEEAVPQLLHAMSRLNRVWEPVFIEFDAPDEGAGTLVVEFSVFAYDPADRSER